MLLRGDDPRSPDWESSILPTWTTGADALRAWATCRARHFECDYLLCILFTCLIQPARRHSCPLSIAVAHSFLGCVIIIEYRSRTHLPIQGLGCLPCNRIERLLAPIYATQCVSNKKPPQLFVSCRVFWNLLAYQPYNSWLLLFGACCSLWPAPERDLAASTTWVVVIGIELVGFITSIVCFSSHTGSISHYTSKVK